MFGPSPTPSRLCKTPVEVPSGTRPRATACTAPVGCLTSATTGSTGRRRFRKGVSQLATCSSTTTYSTSTTAIIVRSVFSCVASRKRAPTGCLIGLADEKSFDRENSSFRVPSGQRSQLFSWQTSGLLSRAQRETVGPLPSREESISFLSPARAAGAPTFCDATESRQRTQPRGLRPLGHPPRLGSESPTEKVRPCAHPLEALQNPGWSAQRHRRGRRCKASRPALQNFSAKKSAASLRPRSPHDGRRYPARQAAIRRSTRRDCVFR